MNKTFKDIKLIFWTLLSGLIHAIALSTFSGAHGLYPSGFSGISRLMSDLCRDFLHFELPFYIPYLILNIIAILLVYKNIGHKFTIYSLIQVITVSVLTTYLKPFTIVDDMLLISVFGGIINGFGISLALQHNSSSGGTAFIAIYVSNKYKRSIWTEILAFNVCVLILAGLVYGWERALYSIIYQYCSTTVISHLHKRYTHETITIITRKPEEVIHSILSNTRHGITVTQAKGAYLKLDETMLYMVVNSFETNDVIHSALKEDPEAFINIQDSKSVIGNFYQKPLD